MKIKFLKLKNWLLMSIMGLLGFSGCKSSAPVAKPEEPARPAPREEIRLMYGVPTMNYMIQGQVRDADGRPISNIRVNMLERNMAITDDSIHGDPERVQHFLDNSAVITDLQGHFIIQNSGLPQEEVRLLVRDVDGEIGGDFQNRVVVLPVDAGSVDRTNAGGWNQGTFNKTVDIKLENK